MAWIPIPRPDQIVSASMNVAKKTLYGGLADLRPMPRTLIDDGTLREVYHYRPAAGVSPKGDPVLLVTPLAAPRCASTFGAAARWSST
jgi:polyhydroxyalkanoate synthase